MRHTVLAGHCALEVQCARHVPSTQSLLEGHCVLVVQAGLGRGRQRPMLQESVAGQSASALQPRWQVALMQ